MYTGIVEEKIHELFSMLSEFDIEWLRQHYRRQGFEAWTKWYIDNIKEIEDFAISSPADRSGQRRWRNPTVRRQLIFFAVYVLKNAIPLLNAHATLDRVRNYPTIRIKDLLLTIYRLSHNDSLTYVEHWWIDDDSPFD